MPQLNFDEPPIHIFSDLGRGVSGALTGLHSLLERMAHKSQKLQFEFVAVLGQISLFTGMNAFWIAGLLLALIDIPDFGTPLLRSRIG